MTDANSGAGAGPLAGALAGPLAGLRVLDLTTIVLGPYATQMLGDFGAEVIKIEAPGGDSTRVTGPRRNPGMAALFLGANRNKKSIELDLKREPAKRALWRLMEGADIFVHNVRPQKIARLGFDPDSVLAHNPKIIYGALHGYREDGPYAGRPAYDDVIQGESGLAGLFTARDGAPSLMPTVAADKTAGLLATSALLAAVIQRFRTGRGAYVETAMFEALAAYTLIEHQFGAIFDPPASPPGYPRALTPHRRPYATKDGHICVLAYTDRHFRRLWELAGTPEIADDPRFATMSDRADNIGALYELVGEAIGKKTSAQWLDDLRAAEIPCGPVNLLSDLRADPHLQAIGFFRPYDHPSEGALEVPDTPFRFDRQTLPIHTPHPRLNEHGPDLLAEAGFSEAEIAEILEGTTGRA